MNELEAYVIQFFSHLMNPTERRVHSHLLAARPLNESEQRLCNGMAWEEARGHIVAEGLKSFIGKRYSGLSNDPEILRLASGGFEELYVRTARRILAEDRDNIFVNNCPSCGRLARTPQARHCRFCGHDWHGKFATNT
jgi:hypothetical protein